MTRANEEYEFARKIIRREEKKPSGYSNNRRQAAIERVAKEFGDKGAKEFLKEFKKEYRRR